MKSDFEFVPKHMGTRTNEAMKPVLLHPEADAPAVHYYMIRAGGRGHNITVWEPGTVGDEYIKTFGHYHVGKLDETYWVIHGDGIILLQTLEGENGNWVKDRVKEFTVVPVKAGDSQFIAAGTGHLALNTGDMYLVTADDSPVNFDEKNPVTFPGHADYELVRQMRGFAYYVVERDGKPALLKNPRYKEYGKLNDGGLPVVGE